MIQAKRQRTGVLTSPPSSTTIPCSTTLVVPKSKLNGKDESVDGKGRLDDGGCLLPPKSFKPASTSWGRLESTTLADPPRANKKDEIE
jgi:hypothetical protein